MRSNCGYVDQIDHAKNWRRGFFRIQMIKIWVGKYQLKFSKGPLGEVQSTTLLMLSLEISKFAIQKLNPLARSRAECLYDDLTYVRTVCRKLSVRTYVDFARIPSAIKLESGIHFELSNFSCCCVRQAKKKTAHVFSLSSFSLGALLFHIFFFLP